MEKILEQALLYDFYGELLTEHQKQVYEDVVLNDYSLSEVAESLGISRQGVFDNLSRTEALLRNMEEKTGCVRRDLRCRRTVKDVKRLALQLSKCEDRTVSELALQIIDAVGELEE